MEIDAGAIRKLAELLEETGLNEIEVADGDKALRVSKGSAMVVASTGMGVHASFAGSPAMLSDPTTPQPANTDAPGTIAATHPGAITSPMVGTVYLQSEPGSAPFVKKGAQVSAGDTLVIIEAMKVMNPIKAEKGGMVTQVLVENGEPVEYGDVLMVIE